MIPLAIIVPVSLDRRALVSLIVLLVVVALGCVLHIGRGGGSQLLGPLDVLANVFNGNTREDSASALAKVIAAL